MEQQNKQLQKMSIYFTLGLLERVRKSAARSKRSFNKEAQWLIERGLDMQEKSLHKAR